MTDHDINLLAFIFNGIIHPTGYKPTGGWLANEALAAAAERDAGRAHIVEMYDQGKIAKNPSDNADFAEMAEEPYKLLDLAEKLRPLSDAEAMAVWVRVRERLESWRSE